MSGIMDPTDCSICKKKGVPCFALDDAICEGLDPAEKEGKSGCMDCLVTGRYTFSHDTEFGLVDASGIDPDYRHNDQVLSGISDEAIRELCRTPQFITCQQEFWLGHCSDFMAYIGTWVPEDFIKNDPDRNGRALFLGMTKAGQGFYWDEYVEPAGVYSDWYISYYAFECRHCGKLRGYWDCD